MDQESMIGAILAISLLSVEQLYLETSTSLKH